MLGVLLQKKNQELKGDIRLATAHNKVTTQNWIAGESFQTFQEASHTFVDGVAVFLNILFTVIAFTCVFRHTDLPSSLFCAVPCALSMRLAKPLIHKLSNQIQSQKRMCSAQWFFALKEQRP
ncbi:hypothetical protein [Candidatus Cardinium sp. TP]|uniref:hypothetical protein n=1 Tax=Candidatus Cardinium sp. TP TaxID=2961955 RepID=UPI0021AE430C|nr:hypothetical protein [Candidatus Cardinium sp. TP]MCT4697023.1 hypothetical protein [Candidatus Cardinium sp. TP]